MKHGYVRVLGLADLPCVAVMRPSAGPTGAGTKMAAVTAVTAVTAADVQIMNLVVAQPYSVDSSALSALWGVRRSSTYGVSRSSESWWGRLRMIALTQDTLAGPVLETGAVPVQACDA